MITYGFFNSVNGDRKYDADQMTEFYNGIVTEGVFQHIANGLEVTGAVASDNTLMANIDSGRAIIQNRWLNNTASYVVNLAAPDQVYGRIDAIVVRLDMDNRVITFEAKTGTPSSSPVAPSLTRTDTIYEICLAYASVPANSTSAPTITDKRSDSAVCGWASVAQAASGEVETMLNDLKTGYDGATYNTPAAEVRGSDQKLQNQITGIQGSSSLIDAFVLIYDNYCYHTNGTLAQHQSYYAGISIVSPGDKFLISGCAHNGAYYLYSFLGSDLSIISHSSDAIEGYAENVGATAPEGAKYLIVNLSEGFARSQLKCQKKITRNDIASISKANTSYNVPVGIKMYEKFFRRSDKSYINNSTMEAFECECQEGDVFRITGVTFKKTYSAFTFLDSSNNIVFDGCDPFDKEHIYFEDYIVKAPANSAKIIVNCSISDIESGVLCNKVLNDSQYSSLLLDNTPIIPGCEKITKTYLNGSGVYTANQSYNCYRLKCKEGDTFIVSGTGNDPVYYAWNFLDSNGNIISHSSTGTTYKTVSYYNRTITAPANADWLVINDGSRGVIRCVSGNYTIDSNLTNGWLYGKKIVWFGTSIPAGQVKGKSYPQMVAETLGATVYNESLGSSPMSSVQPINESRSRALALTYAEKQAESWWSELSDGEKTIARDSSYDYKVTKYLTGGSVGPVDLYVFDHGYNDYYYLDPDTYMEEPEDPNDKSYPLGAANFLINAILNDNPRARIVWIGHYENALDDPTDHQSWGKPVGEFQEYISQKYGIPLCRTFDKTGWSNPHKIATTGYWNSQTWVSSGGSSRQDYVKNCMFADGIHPNTDGSGYSTRLIAGIITDFLKSL